MSFCTEQKRRLFFIAKTRDKLLLYLLESCLLFLTKFLFRLFSVPWLLRASLLILALTTTPSNAIPLYLPSIAEELDLATNNNRTTLSPYEKLLNEEPKWHNPCGTRALQEVPQFNGVSYSNSHVVEPPKESDLMDGIISIARVALRQSRYFKEDYVSLFNFYNSRQFFKEYLIRQKNVGI